MAYVIEERIDEAKMYWNNTEGWVESLAHATIFTDKERETLSPPVGTDVEWRYVSASTVAAEIQRKGGMIENWYHFAEVFAYAEETGKLGKFLSAILYACLPTFFGKPSRTSIMPDSSPHSFYFVIKDRETSQFFMNGGVIFHASSQDWGVHT